MIMVSWGHHHLKEDLQTNFPLVVSIVLVELLEVACFNLEEDLWVAYCFNLDHLDLPWEVDLTLVDLVLLEVPFLEAFHLVVVHLILLRHLVHRKLITT